LISTGVICIGSLTRDLFREYPGWLSQGLRRQEGLWRVAMLAVVQSYFAPTAVAASRALLAEVIIATVLGASDADSRGFLFTDATGKWHGLLLS
jgi:hypothetical protein